MKWTQILNYFFELLPSVERKKEPSEKALAFNYMINSLFQVLILMSMNFVVGYISPDQMGVRWSIFAGGIIATGSLFYFFNYGMNIHLVRLMMLITGGTIFSSCWVDFLGSLSAFCWCFITLTLGSFLFKARELLAWVVFFTVLIHAGDQWGNHPTGTLLNENFVLLYKIQYTMAVPVLALQLFLFKYTKDYLNRKLLKTQEVLQQKLLENTNIIRILTHDVSNPLMVITNSCVSLKREMPSSEIALKRLGRIEKASDTITEILTEVRTLQAVIDGTRKMNIQLKNLDEVVFKSIEIFKEKLDSKKITIEFEPHGLNAHFDPHLLSNQVLNNILSNSIKFSFAGEKIQIKILTEGDQVQLLVRDFGTGMPPEVLRDLFDITAKTSQLGTAGEVGTGFGMPIAKNIIELMGGQIEIKSIPKTSDSVDHGTETKIILQGSQATPKNLSLIETLTRVA